MASGYASEGVNLSAARICIVPNGRTPSGQGICHANSIFGSSRTKSDKTMNLALFGGNSSG